MYTRIDHNPLCDPLLGIPWNERLTSEETTGSEFSDSVFEYPSEVCKEEKTPLEEKKPLPWVVVHAMQYADQKGGDFEVWGVRGDEARVLAYLWRLHDCLQARKTVVAAVEIIANWLGKCRQTVAKILNSLVSEGLISWAFGGAWSYRSKLAREVKWVGIGEADEPQERPCVEDTDPTDWHTLNIIRRLVSEREKIQMTQYRYTVITRNNSDECQFDHRFWKSHPDWEFFVRTDIRHPDRDRVWISGGGRTERDAIESAEFGIRSLKGIRHLQGSESPTIIKN